MSLVTHFVNHKPGFALITRFITLLFLTHTFTSQANTLFKPETLDLSNSAILSMHQDQDGYMWFGTYDGLNLYNGKNTNVYRFEPGNPNSLCSNIIQKITDAEKGYLWISTSMGLNKMSLRERVITEAYPQYVEVRLIASDERGNTLLITKDEFISCYLPELNSFRDVFTPEMKLKDVRELFLSSDNHFYLLQADATLWKIGIDKANDPLSLEKEIETIHPFPILKAFGVAEHLFFLDEHNHLYQYDLKLKSTNLVGDISSLIDSFGNIGNIVCFADDFYIAFTGNGLVKLKREKDQLKSEFIIDIGVFCIHADNNQQILWVGTDGEGVYTHYEKQEQFGNILLDHLPVSIRKPIRSIYTNDQGEVWIGTKGDGIIRIKNYLKYDGRPVPKEEVQHYTVRDGLSNNQVFCFLESKYRDLIWIGTQGPGISYYSNKDEHLYTMNSKDRQIQRVHSICEVNDSTLWMATAGDGLLEVVIEEDKGLRIKRKNRYNLKAGVNVCDEFHSMSFNGDSILLIGSRGGYGVVRFNIYTREYEFLSSLQMENSAVGDVLSVHQSQDSVYYFGASSGLTKAWFRKDASPVIRQFDKNSGMVNDMIHGILEDEDKCIWLSTNKGLTKYNPHNDFFHNYSFPDLKVVEFSDDAYWKCPYSGKLFFGGVNGFVWVDIHDYIPVLYRPVLRFFEMKAGDQRISLNGYNVARERRTLHIQPEISVFSVSFVATDYMEGENYEYSYQLENYTTEWISLQKNNEITFTNLPYGKYTLKVRYKSDVFDSHDYYYPLYIHVLPPWYLSAFALGVYGVCILTLIILLVWRTRRKIIERQQFITQRIREEQKEKLYESKLDFFTNITHELCTPLTLINGVNEHIYRYAAELNEDGLQKYSEILSENVKGLNELINEILDFRKIEESGFTRFHIREISITDIIQRLCNSYLPIAKDNSIEFIQEVPEGLMWNTDAAYLKKIMTNLLSNAFKYTPEQGQIKVVVYKEDKLVLKVINTGEGIDNQLLPAIFDRYHILESMNKNMYTELSSRNGLGLFICKSLVESLQGTISVSSIKNEYTQFTVELPLLQQHTEKMNSLPADEPLQVSSAPELIPADPGHKPVILIVDDNKDILWLISKELSSTYFVRQATNVEEAFVILDELLPVLIITDIMMPGMNGLEFITRLKAGKFTKHVPIVVVSAKISDTDQVEGINLGADAYLTKPFSPVLLHSIVNRLIVNKKELKDYFYSPESAYDYTEGQVVHQEDRNFLDTVTQIIQENLEKENLRPEFIADEMGINTRNLYRRFKKISSLSPSDFIKDYRFTQAARLLVTTNLNVQEIIYKVGINNKSYFYREFQKKYGMTPRDYRQRQ